MRTILQFGGKSWLMRLTQGFCNTETNFLTKLSKVHAQTPALELIDLLIEQPKNTVQWCLNIVFNKLKAKELNLEVLHHQTFAQLCANSRPFYIDCLLTSIENLLQEKLTVTIIEEVVKTYERALQETLLFEGRDEVRYTAKVNVHMFRTMSYKLKNNVDITHIGTVSCENAINSLLMIMKWEEEDLKDEKIAKSKEIKNKPNNENTENLPSTEVQNGLQLFENEKINAKDQAAEAGVTLGNIAIYTIGRESIKAKLWAQNVIKHELRENELEPASNVAELKNSLALIETILGKFSKEDKALSNWYHQLKITQMEFEEKYKKETSLKPERIKENIKNKIYYLEGFVEECKRDLEMKTSRIRENEQTLCKIILESKVKLWKMNELLRSPEKDILEEMVREALQLMDIFHKSVGRIIDPARDEELKVFLSKLLAELLPTLRVIESHTKTRS